MVTKRNETKKINEKREENKLETRKEETKKEERGRGKRRKVGERGRERREMREREEEKYPNVTMEKSLANIPTNQKGNTNCHNNIYPSQQNKYKKII